MVAIPILFDFNHPIMAIETSKAMRANTKERRPITLASKVSSYLGGKGKPGVVTNIRLVIASTTIINRQVVSEKLMTNRLISLSLRSDSTSEPNMVAEKPPKKVLVKAV